MTPTIETFFLSIVHGDGEHRRWLRDEFQKFWGGTWDSPAVSEALVDPAPVGHTRYPCQTCGIRGTWTFSKDRGLAHTCDYALVASARGKFSMGALIASDTCSVCGKGGCEHVCAESKPGALLPGEVYFVGEPKYIGSLENLSEGPFIGIDWGAGPDKAVVVVHNKPKENT